MKAVDYTLDDEIKEVYARFGLAVYLAQVLEHGIVNALVLLDLIPRRRHLVHSREEWAEVVEAFMGRHFRKTLGAMMKSLQSITEVPPDLEDLLRQALQQRNRLAHDFFRERSEDFMTSSGRERMLVEIDESKSLFEAADKRLDEVVHPLRDLYGLTDEVLRRELERMKARASHDV